MIYVALHDIPPELGTKNSIVLPEADIQTAGTMIKIQAPKVVNA
jgi:hypothetical protein